MTGDLDHLQLAIPPGGEPACRAFYVGVLGFREAPKPAPLAARGGLWLVSGDLRLHLGVEDDFRPAAKAHPAFRRPDLDAVADKLRTAGCPVTPDATLTGVRRLYTTDPCGNRIELVESAAAMSPWAMLARNNAFANQLLLAACAELDAEAFALPRTSFFPSLKATLNHLHAVDLYYVGALTGDGLGRAAYDAAPVFDHAAEMAPAQAALDARLTAFCDAEPDPLAMIVTDRSPEPARPERTDRLLLHLFQHQIHHRGQVHAMLAGTGVPPPQLDDFFLDYARDPRAPGLV